MKKLWGVVMLVFFASILLRLAFDALQPVLPYLILIGVVVFVVMTFWRPVKRLRGRRSRF